MGRARVRFVRIEDSKKRASTFFKRKAGVFKKCMELSLLTDVDVAVVIMPKNREPDSSQASYTYRFASDNNFNDIIERASRAENRTVISNEDILSRALLRESKRPRFQEVLPPEMHVNDLESFRQRSKKAQRAPKGAVKSILDIKKEEYETEDEEDDYPGMDEADEDEDGESGSDSDSNPEDRAAKLAAVLSRSSSTKLPIHVQPMQPSPASSISSLSSASSSSSSNSSSPSSVPSAAPKNKKKSPPKGKKAAQPNSAKALSFYDYPGASAAASNPLKIQIPPMTVAAPPPSSANSINSDLIEAALASPHLQVGRNAKFEVPRRQSPSPSSSSQKKQNVRVKMEHESSASAASASQVQLPKHPGTSQRPRPVRSCTLGLKIEPGLVSPPSSSEPSAGGPQFPHQHEDSAPPGSSFFKQPSSVEGSAASTPTAFASSGSGFFGMSASSTPAGKAPSSPYFRFGRSSAANMDEMAAPFASSSLAATALSFGLEGSKKRMHPTGELERNKKSRLEAMDAAAGAAAAVAAAATGSLIPLMPASPFLLANSNNGSPMVDASGSSTLQQRRRSSSNMPGFGSSLEIATQPPAFETPQMNPYFGSPMMDSASRRTSQAVGPSSYASSPTPTSAAFVGSGLSPMSSNFDVAAFLAASPRMSTSSVHNPVSNPDKFMRNSSVDQSPLVFKQEDPDW